MARCPRRVPHCQVEDSISCQQRLHHRRRGSHIPKLPRTKYYCLVRRCDASRNITSPSIPPPPTSHFLYITLTVASSRSRWQTLKQIIMQDADGFARIIQPSPPLIPSSTQAATFKRIQVRVLSHFCSSASLPLRPTRECLKGTPPLKGRLTRLEPPATDDPQTTRAPDVFLRWRIQCGCKVGHGIFHHPARGLSSSSSSYCPSHKMTACAAAAE